MYGPAPQLVETGVAPIAFHGAVLMHASWGPGPMEACYPNVKRNVSQLCCRCRERFGNLQLRVLRNRIGFYKGGRYVLSQVGNTSRDYLIDLDLAKRFCFVQTEKEKLMSRSRPTPSYNSVWDCILVWRQIFVKDVLENKPLLLFFSQQNQGVFWREISLHYLAVKHLIYGYSIQNGDLFPRAYHGQQNRQGSPEIGVTFEPHLPFLAEFIPVNT